MKAVILAAGRGSRLKSATDEIPKCMVELKGRPLIDYQISALQDAGISEIAVVCGYRKEKIVHPGITKRFENPEWSRTNMVASLFCADEWLDASPCIISYGDIFYSPEVVKNLITCKDSLAISYDINFKKLWESRFENPLDDLESFKINADGYLLEIGKKVSHIDEVMGQYMGLLRFTPESWQQTKRILADKPVATLDMTTTLNILLGHDVPIKAVPVSDVWGEVDDQEDLRLYEQS